MKKFWKKFASFLFIVFVVEQVAFFFLQAYPPKGYALTKSEEAIRLETLAKYELGFDYLADRIIGPGAGYYQFERMKDVVSIPSAIVGGAASGIEALLKAPTFVPTYLWWSIMNWTDGVDLTLEQRRVINPTFDAAVQFGQTLENFSLLHAFNSDLSQRSKLIQFLKQAVHVITLIAVLVFIRRKVFFRPTL